MLLVTGATGYLGAALVELLLSRGMPVRAAIRSERRAAALPAGVEPVVADLTDPPALRRAVAGCEGVFHVAASLGDDLAEARRLNVAGTEALLAAAVEAGVRRFAYTSSSAAIIDETGLVSEDADGSTALTDPYSVTKSEAERLVLATAGVEVVVLNPVNIYGPSPAGPVSYNALFASAAAGELDRLVDAEVGWVLAEDVALGHLLAFERGEPGRRYVLCGEVAGFGSVLNRYAELVGSPHRIRALPPGSSLGADATKFARRSEVYGKLGPVRVADAGTRALGLAPTGLADGLARTASWMTSQPRR